MSNSEIPQPPKNLQEVKDLLRTKAQELLFAQPQQVTDLQQEIQKLRICFYVFTELETGEPMPHLYKEMGLLTRMLTGKDLETEAEKRRAATDMTNAAERLKDYGIDAMAAQRIARALSTVAGRDSIGDDDADPEPIDPTGVN